MTLEESSLRFPPMLVWRLLQEGWRMWTDFLTYREITATQTLGAPVTHSPAPCTRYFPAPHTGHILLRTHTGVCSHSAHNLETHNKSYVLCADRKGILHIRFSLIVLQILQSKLLTPLSFLLYGSRRRFRMLSNRFKVSGGLSPPGCEPKCVRPVSSPLCRAIIWPTDCLKLVFCCFLGSNWTGKNPRLVRS